MNAVNESTMKIALVNPPIRMEDEFGKLKAARNVVHSLGIGYLASVARNDGFSVKIYDCPVEKLTFEALLGRLKEQGPRIIGYSATTLSIGRAIRSAGMVKEALPQAILLIGGSHLSALPEETMQNSVFDIGVIGEGEVTFTELIKAIRDAGGDLPKLNLDNIEGIIYRKGEELLFTKPRAFIKDISTLPFPARDLFPPLSRYHPTPASYRKLPQAHILTSRGCPYLCKFCDRKMFGARYRQNSAERVAEEIEELIKKYGAKEIKFYDDIFILDKRRFFKIFELIRKKGLRFPWTCQLRIDNIDKDILREMKKMGCWQILCGLESGDQRMLDHLAKGITLEQVKTAVGMIKKEGLTIRADFMVGFPGDTKESFWKTLEFAKSLNVDVANFNTFTPLPGTELYNIALREGKIRHKDYDSYRIHCARETRLAYIADDFTGDELKDLIISAHKQFYLRPSYILEKILSIRGPYDIKRYLDGFRAVMAIK